MHLLIWILLLAVAKCTNIGIKPFGVSEERSLKYPLGVCEAAYWQKLTCPYEVKSENQLRVWCRQSSTDCCSGFTFSHSDQLLDGGNLKVTQQGSTSFTVEVLQPRHGGGVYWCGLLSTNNTIIKLAEGYIHSLSDARFARWILLPVLPMVTIFTNLYARKITKHIHQEDRGAL